MSIELLLRKNNLSDFNPEFYRQAFIYFDFVKNHKVLNTNEFFSSYSLPQVMEPNQEAASLIFSRRRKRKFQRIISKLTRENKEINNKLDLIIQKLSCPPSQVLVSDSTFSVSSQKRQKVKEIVKEISFELGPRKTASFRIEKMENVEVQSCGKKKTNVDFFSFRIKPEITP